MLVTSSVGIHWSGARALKRVCSDSMLMQLLSVEQLRPASRMNRTSINLTAAQSNPVHFKVQASSVIMYHALELSWYTNALIREKRAFRKPTAMTLFGLHTIHRPGHEDMSKRKTSDKTRRAAEKPTPKTLRRYKVGGMILMTIERSCDAGGRRGSGPEVMMKGQ